MAKGNGNKKEGGVPAPAAYFKSLTIENVKCFKGEYTIDLSDGQGRPAQWTVILGNNNTGKTTILKCLAGMEAKDSFIFISDPSNPENKAKFDILSPFLQFNDQLGLSGDSIISADVLISILDKSLNSNQIVILGEFIQYDKDWKIDLKNRHFTSASPTKFRNFIVYAYGASRKMTSNGDSQNSNLQNLFENKDLANAEEWILNLRLAENLDQIKAANNLELTKKVLTSGILPDVSDLKINSREKDSGFENFVEFKTDFGWIRLRELGYGYQTMVTWVLDLVKRMVERYPNSPNPLAEPAIVLVDEIDLHLHPDWQRKIIAHLSKHFPNTQFIVTAHSPLVVQSADEVNLVILKKDGDSVKIEQPKFRTFKGWTVEEILTDLMQLEGQTMSQTYIDLREQFGEALDEDDAVKAKDAYNQLVKILHPESTQRKLLQLQMTSLSAEPAL